MMVLLAVMLLPLEASAAVFPDFSSEEEGLTLEQIEWVQSLPVELSPHMDRAWIPADWKKDPIHAIREEQTMCLTPSRQHNPDPQYEVNRATIETFWGESLEDLVAALQDQFQNGEFAPVGSVGFEEPPTWPTWTDAFPSITSPAGENPLLGPWFPAFPDLKLPW